MEGHALQPSNVGGTVEGQVFAIRACRPRFPSSNLNSYAQEDTMRILLQLVAFGAAVGAFPNKLTKRQDTSAQAASSVAVSNYCDIVVDGTTVVAQCEPKADPNQCM